MSTVPYTNFYDYGGDIMPRLKKKGIRLTKINILVGCVLGVGLLITILNIYQLQQLKEEHLYHTKDHLGAEAEGSAGKATKTSPVVWIRGKHMETGYLDHVKAVFERLGFLVTNGEDEWDVLWVHDYPFITMAKHMTTLKSHQKVNHFPGSGYITNKGSLATLELDAFPRAFRIPKDKDKLLKFANEHPKTKWVQKNNNHRGIRIKQIEELDFESEGSFVQEFVARPFLIDDRKFDIGMYAILTSLNPLRVYIVSDEVLIRFCSKQYYPFDVNDVDKYVVNDAYTPMWEMPSFKDLYVNQKYSFQESFNRYMISKGKNITKLWGDIHDTIRAVYMNKQPTLMSAGAKYKTTRNFFEMVRFDFVLDENLKVYLMEVNMSPNLATGHFRGNRRLYEHVIYNVLRVSGVASMVENHFHTSNKNLDEMLASDRETAVFSDWCTQPECYGHCENQKCSLCNYCLSSVQKSDFRSAYLEHINRGGCRRMFPPDIKREEALKWTPEKDVFGLSNFNDKTRTMYIWYIGMCRKDALFCS